MSSVLRTPVHEWLTDPLVADLLEAALDRRKIRVKSAPLLPTGHEYIGAAAQGEVREKLHPHDAARLLLAVLAEDVA